jgi:ceramide glucosyltransferase
VLTILSAALLAASIAGSFYLVLATAAVRRFVRRPEPPAAPAAGITVLKPLHGDEAELFGCLRSFCEQRYPDCQIVFGVREEADPALAVVRRLMAELPERDFAIVIDPRVEGTNFKVANLENMMAEAKHELLVIADSDIRVEPGYLAAVTAPLADDAVGLVTCLYRGRPTASLAARLGAMWVNEAFLPSAVIADRVRPGEGCFGATIALRRATLEAIGGFAALRDHLADDYALGAAVRRIGKRIVLSCHLVDTVVAEPDLGALFRHELRWARTIRSIAPGGFAASAVTHPLALASLALLVAGFSAASLAIFAGVLCCRLLTARLVNRALGLGPPAAWLAPLRDWLSFLVFAASFCGNTVAWRDRKFRVDAEGRLVADGDTRA